MTKLTNETVRTLPAGPKGDAIYPDSDAKQGVPGLYVRVRKSGARTYVIQWRQGSGQRRATVGKVGVLTLDDARKKARKLLVGIDEGNDPIAAKARARVSNKLLFEATAKDYLDARAADMKASSLDQCRRHLQLYFKPFNRLAISKIDRPLIAAELRTIAKARGAVQADRSRSTLSAFYAWCIGEGYANENPVIGTNKASADVGRDRVLTDAELVRIWNALPAGSYSRIVRLLMLTGQRRDEIGALRWSEVSGLSPSFEEKSAINLPKERTKNSRPHLVPLSPQAVAVLSEAIMIEGRDLVFGEGQGGFSGFSKCKERLDAKLDLPAWTLHDLRRTMATRMADLGVQPHVIEAVLNHVSGHKSGVAGIYNRSTYADEKRAALNLWGAHIATILARAEGANVTLLKRA
ncbi:MAG: integrase arm-type DNA-binding domain-containing protein [Nitrobacter sp.]|uniref:tyrosine-type recombinase/integrase n=1 Tax=Nitrobacter sp. TaxID=29420 RepID=UPI0026399815|nr:site-specific integrase [Nitrobacter sp.]MCV0387639.1 integrase arm-type DNA-binding domain-containing protein [Nitrobacter sp.]